MPILVNFVCKKCANLGPILGLPILSALPPPLHTPTNVFGQGLGGGFVHWLGDCHSAEQLLVRRACAWPLSKDIDRRRRSPQPFGRGVHCSIGMSE